eukprot:TRINITY_DN2712_c0_g1_i2.p1 TRINITY_DN2712_c0_g1~~TRINITY_DN2712_c0_g1_i2.p1  ORF type:complete len:226 (+),score=46.91 TRINITY_DN2712_c0_g1_i2:123-800(+)
MREISRSFSLNTEKSVTCCCKEIRRLASQRVSPSLPMRIKGARYLLLTISMVQRQGCYFCVSANRDQVCGRSIRVDHVRKFRPPKEYTEIGEDEDLKDKKVYKPSGPDGRGWDEFREYTEEELKALEEETRLMKQKENRREQQLDEMNEMKRQMIIDADERWEKLLMKQQVEEENKELLELRKKIKKLKKMNKKSKKKKKEKKEKKHKKDKEKEMSEMPQQSTPY